MRATIKPLLLGKYESGGLIDGYRNVHAETVKGCDSYMNELCSTRKKKGPRCVGELRTVDLLKSDMWSILSPAPKNDLGSHDDKRKSTISYFNGVEKKLSLALSMNSGRN